MGTKAPPQAGMTFDEYVRQVCQVASDRGAHVDPDDRRLRECFDEDVALHGDPRPTDTAMGIIEDAWHAASLNRRAPFN